MKRKVPQIGWNQLHHAGTDPLLAGVPDGAYAYFAHSYYCVPDEPAHVVATTDYERDYASVVRRGNVWGIQCHPEKSQAVGLRILGNFVRAVEGDQLGDSADHSFRAPSRSVPKGGFALTGGRGSQTPFELESVIY